MIPEGLPPLSEDAIALLKQQKITETEPGSILRDFQTLLDFIGQKGIPVSGKHNLLPMKTLAELNQSLSEPITTNLKRPQQKSYPPINGLYLLLRASGLGQIEHRGKKAFLKINSELLSCWKNFNPTERYCNLLESWLIRANDEMLGEGHNNFNEGAKCLQYWNFSTEKEQRIPDYAEQKWLNHLPGTHNLALMKLFGFVQIEYGKPQAGKGYRIKKIKKLPLGDAVTQIFAHAFFGEKMIWESPENSLMSFGELQPILQPYFPEWQNILTLSQAEKIPGIYTFKVSLGKIWRRVAISSQMTLETLSRLILESVDFDSDHLDMFRYKNQLGCTVDISHPYASGSPSTDEVCIADLFLKEGEIMTYIFDFGDWWEFEIQLEKITVNDSGTDYGAIIESRGKAPAQYPDWEEENWQEADNYE
ncbi:Plasmid pRiA4b ORF-3-like protein [Xenococcus sp. PCC 7305]|uniref:plasmid pRiA4b ORF-3 family protein n=1 Tax=Xenococcus sp. PCC 7305 TaxID=102125 RepID=UPI0002ACD379|nr:plasmid pRiA4b ORF-3 family protein [Xenococcus sp. PCC 7305]ELS01003.1 Plasmid pRiA4b ORF-3-like protein [Xenococcus sp. PCC 7305]